MHKPKVKYQQLKEGDVRKEGDEVRSFDLGRSDHQCYGPDWKTLREEPYPQPWRPVAMDLLSWPILSSDLIHLEFRREV